MFCFCRNQWGWHSDTQGHWAEEAIDTWSSYGVVQGKAESKFDPNGFITRAETAQVFSNLLGLSDKADVSAYKDVKDVWYKDAIAKCVQAGILQGKSESKMDPNGKVTRQEFFTMYSRALCLANNEAARDAKAKLTKAFPDGSSAHSWVADSINTLYENGYVKGVAGGKLAPLANINRASVMSLLDKSISTYASKNSNDISLAAEEKGITLIANSKVTTITGKPELVVIVAGAEDVVLEIPAGTVVGKLVVNANDVTLKGAGSIKAVYTNSDVTINNSNTKVVNINKIGSITVVDAKGKEVVIADTNTVNTSSATGGGGGSITPPPNPNPGTTTEAYLTFKSVQSFTLSTVSAPKWNGTMEYSTNASTWAKVSTASAMSVDSVASGDSINYVYLRGTSNTALSQGMQSFTMFSISGTAVDCVGNIETLLDYATVKAGVQPTMGPSAFCGLFYDCTALTTAPDLPATTLTASCYDSMFYGCTSLATAPELPATTLKNNCYAFMFSGCTSLLSPPTLTATALESACYNGMFFDCTKLTTAPELPAEILADNCYDNMFNGCSSLTTAPELPATSLLSYCYYKMFEGCTALTTVPSLNVTTVEESCCREMFNYCASLSSIQITLSATTLAACCYENMFNGCTSLKITTDASFIADNNGNLIVSNSSLSNYASKMFCGCNGYSVFTDDGTPYNSTPYYYYKQTPPS